MKSIRKITLRFPEPKMIEQEGDADRAKRRFFARILKAPDRGTHGVIRWTREELYKR